MINLQKVTDSESGASINDEMTDQINKSEEILHHKNSSEIVNNTQYDNGINLVNK